MRISDKELYRRFEQAVRDHGKKGFAVKCGVSQAMISAVLKKTKKVSVGIAETLGVSRVEYWDDGR